MQKFTKRTLAAAGLALMFATSAAWAQAPVGVKLRPFDFTTMLPDKGN